MSKFDTVVANAATTSAPVVLITGCSSGIGLATALAAAAAGWTCVATLRNPSANTALKSAAQQTGVSLDIRALDVTDASSIRGCVDGVLAEHGRLDAVINNAGAAHVGTIETDGLAVVRATLEVNFFGVVALTQATLPSLRASRGRLITVSSVGGVIGQPFNEAYCAAKFAVEGFMESLAPVAASTGVGVAVVEPGAVASDFVSNAGLDPEAMVSQAGAYSPALAAYLERTTSQFTTAAQPAAEVAQVIVDLLTANPMPFRVQTSDWARQFVASKLSDLDGSAVQTMTAGWVAS